MICWDSLGLLVFKNIIALIIEQRWLCSSRSKDILPPVLIQCRQHRWSTQPLSVLRTAAKDAQGDFYKQFVICNKSWYIYSHKIFSGVVEKCSMPSRCSARPRYIYLPEEKVPSQKELDFCAWRWPLLDAKDKKVERNIWFTFIHYPSDIKTVKVYHKACFTCGNCKRPLDRLTFMSKLK